MVTYTPCDSSNKTNPYKTQNFDKTKFEIGSAVQGQFQKEIYFLDICNICCA